MGILDVTGLKFKYKDVELYKEAEFHLEPREHVVVVGDNGSGKSTFMKIISKNLIPDAGKVTWLPHVSYSYLDQHLEMTNDKTIEEYLTDVFSDLFKKEHEQQRLYESLATADSKDFDKIMNKAESITKYLEENNFYAIASTVGNVVNGLGIDSYGMDTIMNTLSGGQRVKVYLAKLLLQEPDVLLMDEPTNFLDSDHIIWLSKYLKSFNGAFIVVSHDEGFIREIADVVYSLNNGVFTRYKMNYDAYLKERGIREEMYEKAYLNQQKKVKEIQSFIDKNIVRATTTKRAQSRRKMLEKMTLLEKPKNHIPMKLHFPYSKQTGQEVLKLKDLVVGYENKVVLGPLSYLLGQNKKIAILGRNGVGKTTILKTITNEITKLGGDFIWNPSVDLNIFRQEEDSFNDVTPVEYLRYFYHLKTDGELRSVLAKVGIQKDLAIKKISELSGGERTKVRLALMTMKKSNVLILDEPTNHLDPLTKLELFDALNEFPGVLILVSHEKDFYDELVDDELYFE